VLFQGVYTPLWEFGNDQGTARLGDFPSFWSQYVLFFCFVGAFAVEYSFVVIAHLRSKKGPPERLSVLLKTASLGLTFAFVAFFLHAGLYVAAFGVTRTRDAVRVALEQ
jgi:RsiW-degrading membrane proteinase PrsW (M82 family)